MKYIMISTTFSNKNEAYRIMDELLNERLISCYQITDIESKYHWEGKIVNDKEYLVTMKSNKTLYKEVEKFILNNHSYKVPQIIYYEIEGSDRYMDWIGSEIKDE